MALNKTILKLAQTGELIELQRLGFISWKIPFYSDIYLTVDALMKQGMSKTKAVKATADKFKSISDDTVWRAVKMMEEKECE